MKKSSLITFILIFLLLSASFVTTASSETASSATYEETVSHWTSYKDVAKWMSDNFQYDYDRYRHVRGWQAYSPEETFKLRTGVCQDGANFTRDALNRINPDYHARIVHIVNFYGRPHHWVTAFTVDNKLYIMDYSAGSRLSAIKGIHGPYDSLAEYEKFLSSLNISGFRVYEVTFTDK